MKRPRDMADDIADKQHEAWRRIHEAESGPSNTATVIQAKYA